MTRARGRRGDARLMSFGRRPARGWQRLGTSPRGWVGSGLASAAALDLDRVPLAPAKPPVAELLGRRLLPLVDPDDDHPRGGARERDPGRPAGRERLLLRPAVYRLPPGPPSRRPRLVH